MSRAFSPLRWVFQVDSLLAVLWCHAVLRFVTPAEIPRTRVVLFFTKHNIQARLVIPFTKTVFSVVDRVKSLGAKTLTLTADAKLEELTVSASTDTVSIKTYFRGLACGADNEEGGQCGRQNSIPISTIIFGAPCPQNVVLCIQ